MKKMFFAFLLLAVLSGCAPKTEPAPNTLTIAAASDLRFVLDETIQQFRKANPSIDTKAVYGSSGNFYAQIQNGAPFDVFLSADMEYPRKLGELGFAIPETAFEHAVGRLVVWVRKDSPIDVEKMGIAALTDARAKHVAIANPEHAPYGKAAVAAMKTLGIYEKVQKRLVLGANISETLEFIDSGAAEIGVVAMSLAVATPVQPKGRYWEIPLDAYPRMLQGGIITKSTKNRKAADQFRSFILSSESRDVFKRFGFYMPEDK